MMDVEGLWLTAEDRQLLRQPEVGGLILFARNCSHPDQVRELVRSIRQLRPDMLLAIDQEGGRVQRLRRGVLRLPALGRIASAGDQADKLAEAAAWLMATEILACGIDISFAPVLDLECGRSRVVGDRSLGADPATVTRLASAYIRGLRAAGMAATGKHFPGHGWAEADSHFAVPEDERALDVIKSCDMQPFAALAGQLAGIMPAHVIYSAVDPQPAGFSRFWLQQILRAELGFNGVIFSDDLSMAGAHVAGDITQRIDAAASAGCDMLLVCNDRSAAEQALVHMQQQGYIPSAQAQALCSPVARAADSQYRCRPRWQQATRLLKTHHLL
ncbi:MAG: beta-N-acetylhexosaminidase [Pseudomonadaceae bacterium]|nr:MAG: beta-N-acetylhexosaminidase [Pseudomonadaceae bacterium]